MACQSQKIDLINNSFYLISNEFIPILIKKNLFKNPQKAVKIVDKVKIPSYELDNFDECYVKKPPNAFIVFRSEIYKKVKLDNPTSTSREVSVIIGKMWKNMNKESKLSYQIKANGMIKKNEHFKYKKFLRNIRQRQYIKTKEPCKNSTILSIKKLLFS